MPAEEIEAKNFFNFMCFHGPSAAQPHEWPVLMKNGKVRHNWPAEEGMESLQVDPLAGVSRCFDITAR
jgi:hypothetical protein